MKTLRSLAIATLLTAAVAFAQSVQAAAPTLLPAAIQAGAITVSAIGNGRDALTLTLTNTTPQPISVSLPAGAIAAGSQPDSRVVVVRTSIAEVPPKSAVDLSVPVAPLSSKNPNAAQPFHLTPDTEPRLAPLLAVLADQPDAPRPTVQLAVLATSEDLHFSQWRQFLGAQEAQPTPAEITQAIDALGLLKTATPEQNYALAGDSDLKLRALRNPWSRAKAVAVYGLDSADGATPPDLRQLLHTQPGDNCPICRQRALMQKQADIP